MRSGALITFLCALAALGIFLGTIRLGNGDDR